MKIKIYQINSERDEQKLSFMPYGIREKLLGTDRVDGKIYDCVYDDNVDCSNLEDIYKMFNSHHPTDFEGRSLSVSDIIEVCESEAIEKGFYYCDFCGYCKIEFDSQQCGQCAPKKERAEEKITVLFVEPGRYPKLIEIPRQLKSMQKLVGGWIEVVRNDDDTVIVVNEEGKINGMALNRAIYSEFDLKTISYSEMKRRFYEHEKSKGEPLEGYIVFSKDSFQKDYTEIERTYIVSSQNNAYMPNKLGHSIFGYCLDGSDKVIRLDQYMIEENGQGSGWKVERCYIKEKNKGEMVDIIAGAFFVCFAPSESEHFLSIPENLALKYAIRFRYPQHFIKINENLLALPYKPKE